MAVTRLCPKNLESQSRLCRSQRAAVTALRLPVQETSSLGPLPFMAESFANPPRSARNAFRLPVRE